MDTFTTMVGVTSFVFLYMGERFKVGAYLWLSLLFAIIFALRMAEWMFYIATAGTVAVLAYRTFFEREDVRNTNGDRNT